MGRSKISSRRRWSTTVAMACVAATVGFGAPASQRVDVRDVFVLRGSSLTAKHGADYVYHMPSMKLGDGWTYELWKGDSSPYERARKEVEHAFWRNPARWCQLAQAYLSSYRRDPTSALLAFRWGTLVWLANVYWLNRGVWLEKDPRLALEEGRIRWVLALVPDPDVLEFARLRLLWETSGCDGGSLMALAGVVRKYYPKDIEGAIADLIMNARIDQNMGEGHIKRGAKAIYALEDSPRMMIVRWSVSRQLWLHQHDADDARDSMRWMIGYLHKCPHGSEADEARRLLRITPGEIAYVRSHPPAPRSPVAGG